MLRYVGNNPVNFVDPFGLHWMINPATGQPTYHSHGDSQPGWSSGGTGPVTPTLPPDGGTEAFNQIAGGVAIAYGAAAGGGIACEVAATAVNACLANPVTCSSVLYQGGEFISNFFEGSGDAPMTPAAGAGVIVGRFYEWYTSNR